MATAVSHGHARRSGASGPPDAPKPVAVTASGTTAARTHRKPFSSLMKRLAGLKTSHHFSATQNGSVGHKSSHPDRIDNSALYKSNTGPSVASGISRTHSGKHRSNSHPSLPIPLNTTSTIATVTGPSCDDVHKRHHQQNHSAGSDSASSSPSSQPKPSNHTITTTATSLKSPSTFSSPAPSVRSLTTTLTTITSTAPNLGGGGHNHSNYNPHPSHYNHTYAPPVFFNNSPSSHPSLHPANSSSQMYYPNPTANGLLTDNASIITLASSSKRRRRRSFDTDASIRALAPASLWGGSMESLPMSVLSSMDNERSNASIRTPGDRSSLYGRLGGGGDNSSVRGLNSPGLAGASSGDALGSQRSGAGIENYTLVAGIAGTSVGGVPRCRKGEWGEVQLDAESGGCGGVGGEDEEDEVGSVRSRRTASIKTEDEEEGAMMEIDGAPLTSEVIIPMQQVGAGEQPVMAPVILNQSRCCVAGKGKEKMREDEKGVALGEGSN
ncbi:hypothetical protein BDZ91DRAFT_712182 [Kalaharituber pfeilii]|nr:hypothetical protein BDZ91DRAFT_712182 [Kalaharituber pfeilii]